MFSKLFHKKDTKAIKEKFFGEYFPSEAPNKKHIAYRALCLGVLLSRNEYEYYKKGRIQDPIFPITEDYPTTIVEWFTQEGIANYFSENEKKLLNKPLGTWTDGAMKYTSWRNQSVGTLLWSLSYYDEIPQLPDGFRLKKNLVDKIQIFKPAKDFFQKAALREVNEIRKEREIAELWHWRIRKGLQVADDVQNNIKNAAFSAYQDGLITEPIKNDFPISNKAFSELTQHEFQLVTSLIMERHLALNWLCGYSKNWDETPTDT
jgi:hypothetical protein